MSSNDSSSVSSSYVEQSSNSDSNSRERTDSSVSSTTGSSRTNLSKEEQEELAAAETRLVRRSRLFFITLLLFLAALAGVVTYTLIKKEEQDDFALEFNDFAYEIDDVSHHKAHTIFGTVQGVAHAITSLGEFVDADWPHFTIPHFHQRANELTYSAGADFVAVSPIVGKDGVYAWENYTANNHDWLMDSNTPEKIHPLNLHDEYHVPVWQTSPTEDITFVNYDLFSNPTFHRMFDYVLENKEPLLSEAIDVTSLFGPNTPNSSGHPKSMMIQPIFQAFEGEASKTIVSLLIVVLPWDLYFANLLHKGAKGVHVTLKDSCGDVFSYKIDGPTAHYVGQGDLHNAQYDELEFVSEFKPFPRHTEDDSEDSVSCHYSLHLYPTEALEDDNLTSKPIYMTVTVVIIFVFTTFAFATYDCLVQRRQKVVMESAMRSNAIVSSLFPADVRDRLFNKGKKRKQKKKAKEDEKTKRLGGLLPTLTEAPKFRLNHFLREDDALAGKPSQGENKLMDLIESKPIADLFPRTTVMFGDIVGFTAWSSVRDPTQVFMLLETLYRAFDHIAKRRRVFKVETIGDCYVAVAGLPEPRKDHAAVMARFARDCLDKLKHLTARLEVALGPDTGDLTIRIGLHSGPVTAGVLRGDKSRFQLFGDTVNTASRMESTGEPNRIQISEDTANLLNEAGKGLWLIGREDHIVVKGKGEMKTFWLTPKVRSHKTQSQSDHSDRSIDDPDLDHHDPLLDHGPHGSDPAVPFHDGKIERMVGWSVDILANLLKQIVAMRNDKPIPVHEIEAIAKLETIIGRSGTVQEEVTEFVALPKFDKDSADQVQAPDKVELPQDAVDQLRQFVRSIATMYKDNPFHNFEHASHVTMSVSKLLARIVAADVTPEQKEQGQGAILADMHDRTYGITSDPITQFAVVFSALIHDVDHRGLPNFLLVKEDPSLASIYGNRSVAEQNSVDVAWEKLMEPEFDALRACIYHSTSELKRFRQTVVNTVLATDIFDKDFAMLRTRRWARCFQEGDTNEQEERTLDDINRRATIVIEHLIQASDVAHTMQHWKIYQKWNKRLFEEMYTAYKTGRCLKDPSQNWYGSELAFFDNYIIPLAKKLRECGVFGVSSDEYLNYALENRREWATRGEDMVAQSVASLGKVESEHTPDAMDQVRD